jgi:hypothetical protein
MRDEALHARLAELLRERVLERAGCSGDALALAMRVLVGAAVGLRMERDLAALLPLQCEDGGWGPGWIYKYGSSDIKIGNRGLTTALALNAIAALHPAQPQPQQTPEQERGREKALVGEGGCAVTVEIAPAPVLQLPVTSVLHDLGDTDVTSPSPSSPSSESALSSSPSSSSPPSSPSSSSPPSSPLPQVQRQTRRRNISVRAFVKGILEFLYPRKG